MCITVKLKGYKECTCTCRAKQKPSQIIYWLSVAVPNATLMCYSTRLNEERKEKINNSEFPLFTVRWPHENSSWTFLARLGQYMTAASIGF